MSELKNTSKTKKKELNYLLVNRGRYLCAEHGAFCDSSDGYLKSCPLCKSNKNGEWTPNYIDRSLQLINGLQGRSKRNLTIVSGLFGGAGLLRLLSGVGILKTIPNIPTWVDMLSLLAAIFLIASIAFYAASMRQVNTTDDNKFPSKTVAGWEDDLASQLSGLESWHRYAGRSLVIGVSIIICIFISLLITIFFNSFNFCL